MPTCVDDLTHQAEQVSKVAWGDEPAVCVGEAIEAMWLAQGRLDLAILLAVRSFECRGEQRAEGHASVTSWLQHHLRCKRRVAERIARLSRFLADHPVLEDGMRSGVLSFDHVEAIANAYNGKVADDWEQAFPHIIECAADMRFEDLVRDLQSFADSLRPKDAEDRFNELLAGRRFSKTPCADFDDFGHVRVWMDPLSYRIFAAEHDRIVNELFEQDWAFAKDLLGRDPDRVELSELTRSPENRAHDALVEMARRSRTLAGGAVAAAAEVVLHTTLETYEEAERHLCAADPDDEMTIPSGGFCETDDGTPVSPVVAVYAALHGRIRRIVFDAGDEIINYGRARRPYTPIQSSALRAKYRRCTHPYGCDRIHRLQIDHDTEWQDGGPTDASNGRPMDGSHNRWKTNTRGRPPPPGRRDDGQRRGPPAWS